MKTATCLSVTFDHCMNCCLHCITETLVRTVSAVKAHSVGSGALDLRRGTEYKTRLLDRASCSYADKCFSRPTGQHNNAGARASRTFFSPLDADRLVMYFAYPFPNILLKLVSWYGRITVAGLRSMSRLAFTVSFRKSYSSSIGYSSTTQRFFTS